MNITRFLIAFILPFLLLAGYLAGGAWHLLTPLFVFGVIPLLDFAVGRNTTNIPEESYRHWSDAKLFRWITFLYVPLHWVIIMGGVALLRQSTLPNWELFLFAISTGLVTGGVGITLAHELGHRSTRLEQFLAKSLLLPVCYLHFFIEHNKGHHANVGTPNDPATARFGEPVYRFIPRSVIGGFRHACEIEARRLDRKGIAIWSHHNAMIWYVALQVLLALLVVVISGFPGLVFFLTQAIVAFTLLELVNYVEHYGLSREQTVSGRYEKVNPLHSWNASETVTNSFLFNLQRHSDHHANPGRRYQTLRHFDESPQLPTGYAGMILLALVPPLWQRVMHPRIFAHRKISTS
ncbi:Alkane 1-monooxygenase [Sulfidibacter corallicola]|uniref:Alkane 1-monooxygenase n=1 Tax=Sulfidibacter corallicola TaxID=2818388 RepID=A0A8A4TF17_SULCO|nr:alkane 1-monooxygenase [Sulfidibacter corallicola]QTD48233.1 alkane 1-monooxygenase [Sulfidibacter corallicola]